MQILNRLTIRNLKLNKRRTIVTIIGIILATALLTAVATMAVSLKESVTLRSKKVDGDFHLLLYDMTDKEKESVINNRQVESYYETHEVGYGVLDGCVNDSKPYVYIEALDSDTFEKAEINVTSGRLPEDDSEIVISSHIKTNGGVKYNLGDKITFDIGDRTYNGKKLYQNDTYREDEQLEAKQTKTYKVVGICDRLPYGEEPRTAPGYSVITLANKADTSLNKSDIYLRFNKKALKDRYDLTADILGVDKTLFNKLNSGKLEDKEIQTLKSQLDKTHSYYINNSLIKYEAFYDSSVAFVYNMAAVVMVIIIITSAVCISNSFAISINQKTKQYGMLASIGATPRQIRKNVFFEAAFMGVIGIVAGIGGGLSASYILVVLSNKMLIDTFEMSIVYAPSLLGVLLSIVLAIVTIVLSALVPAIRASRMSPIMAINHSEDIKIKSKSLRTPELVSKVWGEGGVLAYKNMKRNKRKYRVITISIALSVMTFIALYGFMSLLTDSATDTLMAIKIFLYGFIAVVSLIGITNIFNTVTTGMELRGKEFAMLQSIGMTKREFDKMIRMESVFYGSKALIIGVVSGTLLSYVIYIAAGESQLRYVFPLQAIVIAVVVVIILLLGIMKYSIVQIRKQNIIETIRNENI